MATQAKKTVVKKKAAAVEQEEGIYGYCMKTKQNELMQDVTIKLQSNRYIAQGTDAAGNKITKIMSKAQAEEAVANGWADMAEEAAAPKKKVVVKKK